MSDEEEFNKRANAALSLVSRDLASAADDYGFRSSFSGGAIHVDGGSPSVKLTIASNAAARQIWVQVAAKSYKLDWDIVEAGFVHAESGQTLREVIEQALSKQLQQEVTL